MALRNYSNTAPPVALTVAATNVSTTLTVASTTGYPAAPFLLGLERGTPNEEVCLCTATTATTFTVTRGFDSTSAVAHAIGTSVEHTVAGIDYREANTHVNSTTGVHGVAGRLSNALLPVAVTATYTAVVGDLVRADATTAAFTVTLPTGAVAGDSIAVRKVDGTANAVTVAAGAGDSLDTGSLVLTAQGQALIFRKGSGTLWSIENSNPGYFMSSGGTISGSVHIGSADTNISEQQGLVERVDTRSTTLSYTSGNLSQVLERSGATTVKTTYLNYTGSQLTSVQEVVNGRTITTTLAYDGSGNLTGTSRTVA